MGELTFFEATVPISRQSDVRISGGSCGVWSRKIEEMKEVLRNRFMDAEFKLEPGEHCERIHGFIIWEGFVSLGFLERQKLVSDTLRNALKAKAQQVGMLFTYTPNEYEQLQAA